MLDDVAMKARDLLRASVWESPRGTQARIARTIGVSSQTVSAWLSGELAIQPKWFQRLEEVCGIEPFSFAEVTGLAEALGLDELDTLERKRERWEMVYPSDDPDALPPLRETTKPDRAAMERRITAMERALAEMRGALAADAAKPGEAPEPRIDDTDGRTFGGGRFPGAGTDDSEGGA